MDFNAPDINYGGISPIIALTGGLVLTLLAGLIGGSRRRQLILVSVVGLGTLAAAAGLLPPVGGAQEPDRRRASPRRSCDRHQPHRIAAAAFCIPLSWREEASTGPSARAATVSSRRC